MRRRTSLFLLLLALLPAVAYALDYRSVSVPRGVMYDAPSTSGKKLFIVSQFYPVEVIVDLGVWVKVRDKAGELAWIESRNLTTKRTVLATERADVHDSANASGTVVFRVDKDVALEMVDSVGQRLDQGAPSRRRNGLHAYLTGMGAMKIAVLGAGAFGTSLAIHGANRHDLTLWTRNAEHLAAMRATRTNNLYLPGFDFPRGMQLQSNLRTVLQEAELVLSVVPTAGLRHILREVRESGCRAPVAWACKGLEAFSAKMLYEVAAEELPAHHPCGPLSGPSFAKELAAGLPTALTLASRDAEFARQAAAVLHGRHLRVYSSTDVIGVSVGGALKNVIAIAAGICDGMAFGNNARAALITRGLAEITRFGVALGARSETMMGLAGAGDLILTCTGDLSRNRQVGLRLAKGETLDAILGGLGHVAEGVHTAREVVNRAQKLGIEMPITHQVHQVLSEGLAPRVAVENLLNREQKAEIY